MRIENAFNIANPVLHVKEKLVACFVSFQLIDAGKLLNKYNFQNKQLDLREGNLSIHILRVIHIYTQ